MGAADKRKKQEIEQKRKEQRKMFKRRLATLMRDEYRYSLRFEEAHVFDDGKAYINVDLTKVETPFSVYSYDNRIIPEIYDYINQETWFIPADVPIVVNFDDDGKYSDEMKTRIKKAVIRHYSLEYEDQKWELNKSRKFGLATLIIGLLLLSAYVWMSIIVGMSGNVMDPFNFIKEPIQILAWVCIWETVDRFAMTGFDDTVEVLNAGQLALMEVQFGKPMIKKVK